MAFHHTDPTSIPGIIHTGFEVNITTTGIFPLLVLLAPGPPYSSTIWEWTVQPLGVAVPQRLSALLRTGFSRIYGGNPLELQLD